MRLLAALGLALTAAACTGKARSPDRPDDSAPSAPAAALPFELDDNRVFVDVRVDDSEPLRFALDTGGSWVVDAAVARRLQLPEGERFTIRGAGPDGASAFVTQLDRVTLGDLVLRDQQAVVLDLAPIRDRIGLERFDGVLGAELLSAYTTEIDYDAGRVRLWPGDRFRYTGDGTVIPFELRGGKPLVRARVDGIAARLIVDTGDRSCLTLNAPFVAHHVLGDEYDWSPARVTGIGIGGEIRARTTLVSRLELASLAMTDVRARAPTATTGVFASSSFDGTVGNGALRARRVYIAYRDRQLIVEDPAPPRCPGPLVARGHAQRPVDAGAPDARWSRSCGLGSGQFCREAGGRFDDEGCCVYPPEPD